MTRAAALAGLLALTALGGLTLRLPDLDARPMHSDEAVHAYKFNTLWQTGVYRYDPLEYHGPTLYYATFPSAWLSGARDWRQAGPRTYRIVPVVFGVGLILLLALVADGLGPAATVVAAALTALSPALTFYSRYYIQETLLVFFSFLLIAAGWRYVRTGRAAWALLAGAGAGFMHATKETCIIVLGAMAGARVATALWERRGRGLAPAARPWRRPAVLGAAVLVAAGVSTVLFSTFFTNASGPLDAWRALPAYFARAGEGLHTHPWHYYLRRLACSQYGHGPVWSEALILVLAGVGIVAALWPAAAGGGSLALPRFLAWYALLLTLAYSAIPYKTPWCALGFLHACVLLAGVGAAALLRRVAGSAAGLAAVGAVLVVGGTHLGVQAWRSGRLLAAESGNPYIYAHPLRGGARLAAYLEQLAELRPDHPLLVKVYVPNCWPLPWYLRRLERVGYWEDVPPEPDADVIVVARALEGELPGALRGTYAAPVYYGLRRDETVAVLVRQELRSAFEQRHAARAGERP